MESKSITTAPAGLGNKRYLYSAFLAAGALATYLLARILTYAWALWAEPSDFVIIAIAGAVGFAAAVIAYRNPMVNQLANEVIGELAKVTWPTQKETTAATIVVIVVSVIAAIVLGLYDAFWSWLTDLIYVT